MPRATQIALGSLAVGLVVLAVKLLAWRLTGSVALLSDALESIINVATALAALVAVHIAAQPADDDHPFGHHKAEYFSAVMEGALILIAAALILREAWAALFDPRAIDAPAAGLLLVALASAVNAVWAWRLGHAGRALRSPALAAEGRHLWADVVTSAGVSAGILAALFTGWHWLDPLMALAVALHILWSGWHVVRGSVGGLMDESVPEAELQRMRDVIAANAEGAVEAHDLRARQAGQATFVEFHLVVPGGMSVDAAHEICDRLEAALRDAVDGARITIHVEPAHKAKPGGITVP
ncbi:cation diffusion facilitator family transporter [Pseudoponticoccus marisrubri]|uniref:Protein p34 n=1 Tax=Pseudoponticoccus marisrubri TaxID=1685382 RepID=A0A0W7WQ36_9RHOB|nr:cation diffusion facilitator family transporter [Pseudoponticoccus marisrubri]KUF12628.1 cadmium transporter [Pseudoponticoccus marisrubri]